MSRLSSAEVLSMRLRELRKSTGLTQAELAEKIGVDNTTIGNWESGRRSVSLDYLDAIAEMVGLPTTWFFESENDGNYASREIPGFDDSWRARKELDKIKRLHSEMGARIEELEGMLAND